MRTCGSIEAYRAIRYIEDARDLCDAMRKTYPERPRSVEDVRSRARDAGDAGHVVRAHRGVRRHVRSSPCRPPAAWPADAREALELDRLIFVPAGAQPFKVDTPPVASGQDRLEMVRLAVAGDAKYVVDDTEINRKGLSYTVDTLEHLSERNRRGALSAAGGGRAGRRSNSGGGRSGFGSWQRLVAVTQAAGSANCRR